MARGEYTVQEVEAAKQERRDSSYRTCVITMFIFLVLCIILIVIAWTTTWKSTSEKGPHSHHSKYGGREPTPSLGTEPPSNKTEEPTTMEAHHKEHTHHPVTKTTQPTKTSATTEIKLSRMVASETAEAIKPTNFTTSSATTTAAATTTSAAATITTPDLTTTPATTSSTENNLKQQIMFVSPAASTEEFLTQSKQYDMITHHPVTKTTQPTRTSAITESQLIQLVAFETTKEIKPTNFTTSPATNTAAATTTTSAASTITIPDLTNTTTTTTNTERTLQQRKDSTDVTTPATSSSTENYLEQQIKFISSAATAEESLTQSKQYDMITKAIKSPLVKQTTSTPTMPVTSLDTEQPLSTTTSNTFTHMEGTSNDEFGQVTNTPTEQMAYTVPHAEEYEQPLSTSSNIPVHWQLRTTISASTTDLPDTTQHIEYKTTPNLVQPEPKTSTTETPLFKYTTTDSTHSSSSTFMTEHSQPEDQLTKQHPTQWLNQGQQATDTVTSSTLYVGTDSSASLPESATSTTIFERDGTSDHSESKTATAQQPISSSGTTITETEDLIKNLTTPATAFSNIISATDSVSVNKLSVFTTDTDSTTTHSSTASSTHSTVDTSAAPYSATVDITDTESTTPTNLLTSTISSRPDIQMIYTSVITNTSTDSTAITSATSGTDATDSSAVDFDDVSSQSVSAEPLTDVSMILTTTGRPPRMSVTGPTTAAVTDSGMSTHHSPTASDETSVTSQSYTSQEIIAIATVAPERKKRCATSACKVVSSRMLSLMNHSADPCEDFYEFACGGLRENRNLLQHDPEYEVWTRIAGATKQINANSSAAFTKFKSFYDQCVKFDSIVNKTSRLEAIHKVLDSVGKMYNLTGWIAGNLNLNLTSLLVKLFQLNSAPLFDVQLDVNIHDPSRFSLKLTAPSHQSKLQLESFSAARCKNKIVHLDRKNVDLNNVYLNKYLPCTRDYGQYMNITEKALKELGILKAMGPFNESQHIKDLRFFIEFDILHHLTELPLAGDMTHTLASKKFKSISVADLGTKYPQVNWKTLFNALVGDTVDPQTTVQLYFEGYFDSLFKKLESHGTNNEKRMNLHNALLAMFAHDLYTDLVITQSPCSREDYCLRVASGLLGDVSSALYLSTFTREQLNTMDLEIQTLFTQLKLTLKQQFRDAEWLDNSSRSYLTSKLQQLTAVTDGGIIYLGDSYMLNQRLSDEDMNASNSYIQNAVQLIRRYRRSMYSLYSAEPNATDTIWSHFLLPYDTQAVAVYPLNIVAIPFGLLGSPQSTPDLPEYIFKARFGNDLARQIAHHFDAIGIEYGSSGKDVDLFFGITKDEYNTIHECDEMAHSFQKSWTNHKNEVFTYKVDSPQSKNERFADNSALLLSHKVYKKNAESEPLLPWLDMNHDQLYHMLVAQEFCTKGGMLDYTIQLFESEQLPPFLRVTSMMQNSEAVSEAYSCARGTHMNPETKCNSFPELKQAYNNPDPSPQ